MNKKLLFLVAMLCAINSYAATITATGEAGVVLKNWSVPSSWVGNVVPTAADDVNIPANAEISINQNINVRSITVIGTLSVPNSLATLNITTRYMMIMGNTASFTWGTATTPWPGTGTLTLTGQTLLEKIPGHADHFSKGIVVMSGGVLDIHGAPKTSWTQIAATANAGTNQITLATDVTGWVTGDSIVLATTDYVRSHTEKLRIQSRTGRVVTLSSTLDWKHFGEILTFNNSAKTFDQRAEVGLLDRNITIRGDISAGTPTGYGGYIMSMVGSESRVENVKLYNMGQNGNLGSYPMHWHLAGATSNQYIRGCSIYNSFNRGVVIHGTDNILVGSNVLYQHRGHGFVLEDGDEENNTFNNNLGIGSSPPRNGFAIEPSEMSVATFWITNPNNTFTNNAAVGSGNAGFWLIPVSSVLRAGNPKTAANPSYSPRKFKLKTFTDNTAHGCAVQNLSLEGNMSLGTVQGKAPRTPFFDPNFPLTDVTGQPLEHVFTRFTSYKGYQNGIWTRAAATNRFEDCRIGEASFMAFLSYNGVVNNSLFAGITANNGSGAVGDEPNQNKILGLQMYNGSTDITNTHMAGFQNAATTSCIGNRQSSGKFPNFTASGITFESNIPIANRVNLSWESIDEDPARSYFFVAGMIDKTGSIIQGQLVNGTPAAAGTYANWRITPRIYRTNMTAAYNNRTYDFRFNLPINAADYIYFPNWSAYITRPNIKYGILHNWADWPGTAAGEEHRAIYAIRSDGPATFDQLRTGTDAQLPIILGTGIKYFSQYHETPNRMRSQFKWTTQNANMIAAFMNVPSNLSISKNGVALTEATSLAALETAGVASAPRYFLKDNTLYVKYFATNLDNGLNTSGVTTDYSDDEVDINLNPAGSNTGFQTFVTLADFSGFIDARGSLGKPAGQNIAFSPITNTANTNNFTITKGTSAANYVDYNFTLVNKQIWKEFNKITINYQGPQAILMIRDDASTGSWVTVRTLPYSPTLTAYDVPLTAAAVKALESVEQLKLRFPESAMTAAQSPYNVVLDRMALSLEPATVNTGALLATNSNEILSFNIEENGLMVYPNPASGNVNIKLGSALTDLTIYDISGKIVFTKKDVKDLISITTSEIGAAGVYTVRTNTETTKLIISN